MALSGWLMRPNALLESLIQSGIQKLIALVPIFRLMWDTEPDRNGPYIIISKSTDFRLRDSCVN